MDHQRTAAAHRRLFDKASQRRMFEGSLSRSFPIRFELIFIPIERRDPLQRLHPVLAVVSQSSARSS